MKAYYNRKLVLMKANLLHNTFVTRLHEDNT